MAISGFGNTQNSLSLGLNLKTNQKNKQADTQKEETLKAEPVKVELNSPKPSLGDVKVNIEDVNSYLVGKGIKINKPKQLEEPEEPTIKLNASFMYENMERFKDTIGKNIYKNGDTVQVIGDDGSIKYYTYFTTWIDGTDYYIGIFIGDDGDAIPDNVTDFS